MRRLVLALFLGIAASMATTHYLDLRAKAAAFDKLIERLEQLQEEQKRPTKSAREGELGVC